MARFEPNKPIVTREAAIVVDAGLPPGEYRFQLIVEDDEGRRSVADEQTVLIVERGFRLIDRSAGLVGDAQPEPAPEPTLEPAPRKRRPPPEKPEKPAPPVQRRPRKPK